MAEAAGLAVGTIALASLFQTCLDFLEYIEDARNTKSDQDRGETKLGLLKIRLRQWGDDLQVSHPGHEDGGLREFWPQEGGTISKSLIGIAAILDEAANLNRKYESYNAKELLYSSSDLELDEKSIETHTPRRKYCKYLTILKQRASWALKDKKKLNSLLTELDFFIDNLEKVTGKLLQTASFEDCQSPIHDYDAKMSHRKSQHNSYPPTKTCDHDSKMSHRNNHHSTQQNNAFQYFPPEQQQALVVHQQGSQALMPRPVSSSTSYQSSHGARSSASNSNYQSARGRDFTYQAGTEVDGHNYIHCVARDEGRQHNGDIDAGPTSGRHVYDGNEARGKADQQNGNMSYQAGLNFFHPRSK